MGKKFFIQKAIVRPGALTTRARHHHLSTKGEIRRDLARGTTLQKQQARFANMLTHLRQHKR